MFHTNSQQPGCGQAKLNGDMARVRFPVVAVAEAAHWEVRVAGRRAELNARCDAFLFLLVFWISLPGAMRLL